MDLTLMPDLRPQTVTVLIDSREQIPYTSLAPHKDGKEMRLKEWTFQTGDYGIEGLWDDVRVERKRKDELAAILGQKAERARFKRELERMMGIPQRMVVVEASFQDFLYGDYRGDVDPSAAINGILSWQGQYGTPFFFAGDREGAQRATACFLFSAARRFHEKREAFYGEAFAAPAREG